MVANCQAKCNTFEKATNGQYGIGCPAVAALRRSSREMVDLPRSRSWAISVTDLPSTRKRVSFLAQMV